MGNDYPNRFLKKHDFYGVLSGGFLNVVLILKSQSKIAIQGEFFNFVDG